MRCGFCGHEYEQAEADVACSACPLNSHCGRIRCPRCGYEDLRPTRLGGWLARLWGAGRAAHAARPRCPRQAATLADLPAGCEGCVVSVCGEACSQEQARRLMAVGVVPGACLRVLRRSPAYVFSVGNSLFAVDAELAAHIRVEPLEGEGDERGPARS